MGELKGWLSMGRVAFAPVASSCKLLVAEEVTDVVLTVPLLGKWVRLTAVLSVAPTTPLLLWVTVADCCASATPELAASKAAAAASGARRARRKMVGCLLDMTVSSSKMEK